MMEDVMIDALFGMLFLEYCLLSVITKVELIMLPSTCSHCLVVDCSAPPYGQCPEGGSKHY